MKDKVDVRFGRVTVQVDDPGGECVRPPRGGPEAVRVAVGTQPVEGHYADGGRIEGKGGRDPRRRVFPASIVLKFCPRAGQGGRREIVKKGQ